jgi:ferredoxin--NADP+ reductase
MFFAGRGAGFLGLSMTDTKYIKGVVTSRRDISAELWVVRVRPQEQIEFKAGQYVTIGLGNGAKVVERPYSIASSPHEPELEFFLELVLEGELTPQLYSVPVGEEVLLRRAAKGRLVFDDASGHPNHFMIATVTGGAPFLSMVRLFGARLAEQGPPPYRIAMLHGASTSPDLGYEEELARYGREYPWFDYIPSVSRIWLDPEWKGERGRAEDLTRKYLDSFGFTPADTTAYVCGNPDMIENVKGVLKRAGFPKESVREEQFWVAPKRK